ncbi:condensation domain-containing protein [Microbacterium trichothecenolyticum]|uniref:Aryl carrier-like protein n=1 Tax=Microbacterium trichothecenolyticum TaxID=69370 RepID=A0ABU0TRN7_MICTR|nr:condensation domain-containing protein [Microbacterium trichothecenolyticum]MDQ1122336.1 aryl carrier-like protein [Microbacterium trichothecenolyticum]
MSERESTAPLTPLQRAYLAARDGAAPLGGTGMLDVRVWEGDVDADRVREVVASLVRRHEALRLRIDGETQSVADAADVLRTVDLRGRGRAAFTDLLAGLRTTPRPLDALVEVVHVRRDDSDAVVLCSDALALDGQGLARVITEAARLLADPTLELPPAPTGLLDALRAVPVAVDADRAQRAADDLPAAPRLPWLAALDGLGPIRTERLSRVVDAAIWRRAVLAGGAAGLSAHSVVAGAIGDELAARSGGPVRLSVPTAGGSGETPVGPFAGFVVVGAGADPADAVASARVLQAELFARLDGPDGPSVATALARRDRTAVACPVVVTNGLTWPETPAPVAAWTATPQVALDIRLAESDGALVLTADVAVDALALETVDDILDAATRRLDAVGRPRPAARASSLLSGAKRARMDALLKARGIAAPAAAPAPVDEVVASPSEERMWLLHEIDPHAATAAVALAVRFDGDVDADRLAAALRRTIEDFPSLRTVWDAVEGGVRPRELTPDAIAVERFALDPDEVRTHMLDRARVAFDLATEAPLRVSLIDTRDGSLVLGIIGHHIALDDASWHPFFTRVSAHYDGDAPAIDRGAYRRFAAEKVRWLRGTGSAPVLERWRATLDGATPLTLPAAWQRSAAEPQPVGAEAHGIRRLRAELPRIAVASARTGAGGLHTVAVAVAAVLTAATGRADGVIDLPVLDVEGMGALAVGARGNLVPLRLGVRDDDTVASLTARTVEAVRAATAGGVVPIELIRRTQPALRERPGFLLVGVGDVLGSALLGDAGAREIELPPLATEPGITIAVREGATPALEVTWSADVSETAARALLDALRAAVEALADAEADEPAVRLLRDALLLRPASVAAAAVEVAESVRPATVPDDVALTERADAVLAAFRHALEAPDLGPDDDFFDAGGHSLLATRVIATLRARGVEGLRIGDFFAHPTARALGAVAGGRGAAGSDLPAPPDARSSAGFALPDAVPLLPQQRGIWFLDRFDDGGLGYAIPYVLRFTAAPDADALRAAVRDVLLRHEGLRVLVDVVDGDPRQRAVSTQRLDDLDWWSTDADDLRRGFDLDRELGVRAVLTDGGRSLGLLLHHLVADEWSTGILLRDFAAAYAARAQGHAPEWTTPAPSPLDLAIERPAADASLTYWRERLADAPAGLPVAPDHAPDPLAPADGGWHAFTIAAGTAAGLRAVARRTRSSLFAVLEAAVVATLARLGGSDEVLVAVPVAGRDERTTEVVGMLANTVVLRHRVPADSRLDALVVSVRETLVEALEHEAVPFEQVVLAVGPDRSSGLSPLATTMVQLHSGGELRGTLPHPGGEIAYEIAEPERTHAKFELSFEFIDDAEGLRGGVAFRTALFSPRTVARLTERLLAVIGALADDDGTGTLEGLPIPRGQARAAVPDRDEPPRERTASVGTSPGSPDALQVVLACAAEVLGIPDPAPEASFFALGGDSISSIAFVARLRERGLAAAPRQVFAHPVLVDLAGALEPTVTPSPAPESAPLSASGLSAELLAALIGDVR